MEIYIIEQGDTLEAISRKTGVSKDRIAEDNNIAQEDKLAVGEALIILKPAFTDTVLTDDTLQSIAARNGTDALTLRRLNPHLSIAPPKTGETVVLKFIDEPIYDFVTVGYMYDFITESTLRTALPYLTYAIIFGYGFDESGEIIRVSDERIIAAARETGTKYLLSLSLITESGNFDNPNLARFMTDRIYQDVVLTNMLALIREKGADGMDLDMEYIPPQYKLEFVSMIRNAANLMHNSGYILNVAVAPKTSAEQSGLLYEAHDYRAIGEAADMVFLMTYEWGYKYGPPMAVAPLPNVRQVLLYALTEIPREKIILGIPNYGYDWRLPYIKEITAADTISNIEAVDRSVEMGAEIKFDERAASPYYNYPERGILLPQNHIVWFEDVRSVMEKMDLAAENGILGVGYWNVMFPFNQNFLLLVSKYGIKDPLL
ncbi:MAG: LysM peptidoglycan-binding domain-containing protein [Ruminococcus sp.]|jgi:spore germination protein|nr:LysM peptidoglycan-binding domain-containing protein [Ruminococcus sp.]